MNLANADVDNAEEDMVKYYRMSFISILLISGFSNLEVFWNKLLYAGGVNPWYPVFRMTLELYGRKHFITLGVNTTFWNNPSFCVTIKFGSFEISQNMHQLCNNVWVITWILSYLMFLGIRLVYPQKLPEFGLR